MALDKDRLGDAIVDALKIFNTEIGGANETLLRTAWKVIAKEIIDEFTGNAVVTTAVAVASVSGVVAGGASSGPGAGTGVGGVS